MVRLHCFWETRGSLLVALGALKGKLGGVMGRLGGPRGIHGGVLGRLELLGTSLGDPKG